jgi:hypothetical protein
MRCFYHYERDAVAACKSCGRGLCPDCAADVGNGLACRDRCEEQVRAVNRIIERNKTAYEKTSGAYARTALFYGLVGVLFLVPGLTNWRGLGWVLVPAALIFFFSAWVHFSTGRKFANP